MPLIVCSGVSKIFHRHNTGGQQLLRQHISSWWNHRHEVKQFYALKDVSFEVASGESVAIVGSNGAGKSTLLSLITGLARPSSGSIEVRGKVAALLELGSGFHPDLTGRENLYLNSALLGFDRKQTRALYDSIVDFSGLGEVMEEPLRTYSSGMALRLAFSIAVNVNPDILILDEVLAVGDHAFQTKCMDRIKEFRRAGKTLLFVSHNAGVVADFCDRALWLDRGELILQGAAAEVVAAYEGRADAARAEAI